MHHVRRIKDLKLTAKGKSFDFFTIQMATINRKQVPLCSLHHQKLHNNQLDVTERALFAKELRDFP